MWLTCRPGLDYIRPFPSVRFVLHLMGRVFSLRFVCAVSFWCQLVFAAIQFILIEFLASPQTDTGQRQGLRRKRLRLYSIVLSINYFPFEKLFKAILSPKLFFLTREPFPDAETSIAVHSLLYRFPNTSFIIDNKSLITYGAERKKTARLLTVEKKICICIIFIFSTVKIFEPESPCCSGCKVETLSNS